MLNLQQLFIPSQPFDHCDDCVIGPLDHCCVMALLATLMLSNDDGISLHGVSRVSTFVGHSDHGHGNHDNDNNHSLTIAKMTIAAEMTIIATTITQTTTTEMTITQMNSLLLRLSNIYCCVCVCVFFDHHLIYLHLFLYPLFIYLSLIYSL